MIHFFENDGLIFELVVFLFVQVAFVDEFDGHISVSLVQDWVIWFLPHFLHFSVHDQDF